MPNFMGGLLGEPETYGGLLDANAQDAARKRAQLAMAAQLLANSGWSPQRQSFGQAIGPALMAGQQAQGQSTEDAIKGLLIKSQIAKATAKPARKPLAVIGPDGKPMFVDEQDAIGRQPVPSRENNIPSNVSEWQFYQNLSKEDQARYIEMKRAQQFRLDSVNGVPTAVTAGAGTAPGAPAITATPLTNFDAQTTADSEAARRKAEGTALGEGQGKIASGIQTKGQNADVVMSMLDDADQLIDKATGSTGGQVIDAVQATYGGSNEGAESIAKLKVIQAGLMTNMPRMEGPQSDRDVQLYREAAGQIGNPSVPKKIKKAAVETIRRLQNKSSQRAATAGAPPAVGVPAQRGPTKRVKVDAQGNVIGN